MWNLIKKIAPYFKLFRLIKHHVLLFRENLHPMDICLLYTSDAADDMQCVDLGGRRIIKKFE